jgi:hypothetical protein
MSANKAALPLAQAVAVAVRSAIRCRSREICLWPQGQRPHPANGLRVRLGSRRARRQKVKRDARRSGSGVRRCR